MNRSSHTETTGARISIVTPVYRGERFLGDCLRSVRGQTVWDWEHVVVDDGSPDGSRVIAEAAARQDGRVRVLTQANRGVAAARNRGVAAIADSSRYVLLLDQDDLLAPDALERLGAYLDAHPGACAAFGPVARCDESGGDLPDEDGWMGVNLEVRGKRVVPSTQRERTFAHLLASNPVATPGACLLRREALLQAGEMDADTAPCDDWDLYLRLVNVTGRTIDALGGAHVLRWRQHAGNNSHDHARMARGEQQVFAKYLSGAYGAECARVARVAYPFFRYARRAGAHRAWAADAWRRRDYRGFLLNGLRAARCQAAFLYIMAAGDAAPVPGTRRDRQARASTAGSAAAASPVHAAGSASSRGGANR